MGRHAVTRVVCRSEGWKGEPRILVRLMRKVGDEREYLHVGVHTICKCVHRLAVELLHPTIQWSRAQVPAMIVTFRAVGASCPMACVQALLQFA